MLITFVVRGASMQPSEDGALREMTVCIVESASEIESGQAFRVRMQDEIRHSHDVPVVTIDSEARVGMHRFRIGRWN